MFARENATFEEQLAAARKAIRDPRLLPTADGFVARWTAGNGRGGGPEGRRLSVALMQMDSLIGAYIDDEVSIGDPVPPTANDWEDLEHSEGAYNAILAKFYQSDPERVGTMWESLLMTEPSGESAKSFVASLLPRVRAFDIASGAFNDEAIIDALFLALTAKRSGLLEDIIARSQPKARATVSRLRPTMRLRQLFEEWKEGNKPAAQTAAEFSRSVEDFIDFIGDVPVMTITSDMLYDYRDEAAKLPRAMSRRDRELPFTERVSKHTAALPKCEPATLKKRMIGIQALLTYAFQQRWVSRNEGAGVPVVGFSKVSRRHRRSFQDAELSVLFSSPLFLAPEQWPESKSRFQDSTMFWLFLIGATTGARLEEVGQAAIADIREDGEVVYLDINDYALDDGPTKSVKTWESLRLVPIHDKLVEIGFLRYRDALIARGETQLFPDLRRNGFGKRTNTISQRINRYIDAVVGDDRRLVFHSLRHSFKALGNDAGVSSRVLDQICGHAPIDVASRYGSEPRIRTIHRELHRIDFSCLGWPEIVEASRAIAWDAVIAGSAG